MAVDKKISELDPITGNDLPDSAYWEVVDPTEVLPENRNKRITVLSMRVGLGIYLQFEITGITTTAQDDQLIGKVISDIRQFNVGGADQVTGLGIQSFDTATGIVTFYTDFGGAIGVITVKNTQ